MRGHSILDDHMKSDKKNSNQKKHILNHSSSESYEEESSEDFNPIQYSNFEKKDPLYIPSSPFFHSNWNDISIQNNKKILANALEM